MRDLTSNNYIYPRIIQLIPCCNIWIKNKAVGIREYYFTRAFCLALFEAMEITENSVIEIDTYLLYMDSTDIENDTRDRMPQCVIYSEIDLSKKVIPY
jgi:hypothetical protein